MLKRGCSLLKTQLIIDIRRTSSSKSLKVLQAAVPTTKTSMQCQLPIQDHRTFIQHGPKVLKTKTKKRKTKRSSELNGSKKWFWG